MLSPARRVALVEWATGRDALIIEDELDLGAGRAPRPPFKYWDKGTMATIGRSAAVAWIGKLHFSGFAAWLAWLLVHMGHVPAGFDASLITLAGIIHNLVPVTLGNIVGGAGLVGFVYWTIYRKGVR